MAKIEPRYATSVTVEGGREGHAVSDDEVLDVQLRRPKTNGTNDGTNPEQLFAAAWGGCYQQALIGIAKESGEDASGSKVTVEIAQGTEPNGGSGLAAKIVVDIPGLEKEKVQHLADLAHKTCPYSRATRGNMEVEVTTA